VSAPAVLAYRPSRSAERQRFGPPRVRLRPGDARDASALHALISANVERGWLLPRALDELQRHAIRRRARAAGYERLCAFAHDPRPFVGWGFSIVSRDTIPEKIAIDCSTCRYFSGCTQFGLALALDPPVTGARRIS
jgi:N-acetylglutamate synthase-like GNAT family acetyltransferase